MKGESNMNQIKIGSFLRDLRKEKGLTQEELAEHFNISARTVSRWETGSNMPELSILVEMSEFYEVGIKEIIDGERERTLDVKDSEIKDTLVKVVDYSNEYSRKKVKKVWIIVFSLLLVLLAVILIVPTALFTDNKGGNTAEVKIDYGASSIYTKADMDEAIELIKTKFASWEGCELHSISYKSDECNRKENIEWLNSIGNRDTEYTQCIELLSDFYSSKTSGGSWNGDYEYTDCQWWLARTDGGEWHLLTWGY